MYKNVRSFSAEELEELIERLERGNPLSRDQILRFSVTAMRMSEEDRGKLFDRMQGSKIRLERPGDGITFLHSDILNTGPVSKAPPRRKRGSTKTNHPEL